VHHGMCLSYRRLLEFRLLHEGFAHLRGYIGIVNTIE
jgi:hypothetical protein